MKWDLEYSSQVRSFDAQYEASEASFDASYGSIQVLHDGQNGATFTPSVSADGTLTWTNDQELPNPEPVNVRGPAGPQGEPGKDGAAGLAGERGEAGPAGERGETGAAGPAGERGETGAPGKDGVSVTHSWNGTTLTVTSASGTSSANLKGDPGSDGAAGAAGKDGVSPTVTASKSGKVTTLTIKDASGTKTATINDGADGTAGKDGQPGKDGAAGADGVSPTVAVSKSGKVTTVSITDKNGTKTATINDGADGSAGKDGTSVSVASVSESNVDGGSNVVTFSDGKTVTIKNGSKGSDGAAGKDGAAGATGQRGTGLLAVTTAPSSYTTAVGGITPKYRMALSTIKTQAGVAEVLLGDTIRYSYYHYPIAYLDASYAYCTTRVSIRGATGAAGTDGLPGTPGVDGSDGYTPQRGVDYWTPDDKAEIEAHIATELAKRNQLTPEYAESVEWLSENGDQSKLYVLPDGMIYAYMAYENISAGGAPLFTNRVDPTSSDWQTDKRFSSSSGSISSCTGTIVSNTIVMKKGDTIRVKGLRDGSTTATASCYVGFMGYSDAAGTTKLWITPIFFNKTKAQNAGGVKDLTTIEGDAFVYTGFKVFTSDGSPYERDGGESVVCVRVSGEPVTTVDDIIVTINEEIKYSEASSETGYKWQSTGRSFVPADYEDRIVAVEKTATNHTARIVALEKSVESGGADGTEADALARIQKWDKPVYDSAPVTLIADSRVKPALTTNDRTVSAIYAKYRALMAAHPDYITETNMGKSAASDTFTAVDMLRFDFCEPGGLTQPDMADSARHETKPTLIFLSGIHTEWVGVWGLYYALEEIATNPDFDDVRRNAHIVVIPCANPYCLTSQTAVDGWRMSHVNANGVAIHNNFGVNHSTSGTVGEYNYGGSAPYSEPETQYIDAVMAAYPDAVAFVSCHNNDYSTYYGSHVIWASSATYHMCNMAFRLVDKLTKAWMDKYGDTLRDEIDAIKINMDASDYRLGRATMSSSKGTEQLNATKYGIQGVNLEISRMMKVFSGNTDGTAEVMTHGAEVYANFMRTLLWNYDHKDKKDYAPNLPWSE